MQDHIYLSIRKLKKQANNLEEKEKEKMETGPIFEWNLSSSSKSENEYRPHIRVESLLLKQN